MKKEINFNGFSPEARARAESRAMSPRQFVKLMKSLGKTDAEIIELAKEVYGQPKKNETK